MKRQNVANTGENTISRQLITDMFVTSKVKNFKSVIIKIR